MSGRPLRGRHSDTGHHDRGFTLIELIIAIVLSAMIAGVVVAVLITSLNAARSTSDQVTDSIDAGLISSFLIRDAQSAGGINPATAYPDPSLGVSTNPSDSDGVSCTAAPWVVRARLSWIDRTTVLNETKFVVSYASAADPLDSTRLQLLRRVCTYQGTNTTKVDVVLGRNLVSAQASCLPVTTNCSGRPKFVSLTVTGKGAGAPLVSVLTASLRSATSQLTVISPLTLPPGQVGSQYSSPHMTTIGASLPTTWSATGLPAGLSIATSNGVISGSPNVRGPFTVTVTVTDALSAKATIVYPLVIIAPPVAVADSYSVDEDSTLNVAAPGLLTNDVDPEGNPITAILYSGVANGALTFTSNGAFIYSPRANFNGTDSFSYKASNGILESTPVAVTVTVRPVNDPPVNKVPFAQQTSKNTAEVFSNYSLISISDIDALGATVQVQLTATNGTVTLPGATGVTSTGGGTATMTVTGAIANINLSLVGATFTPTTDFIGSATLQIITSDQGNTGSGGTMSDTDVVTINVGLGIFAGHQDVTSGGGRVGDSSFTDPIYTVSDGKAGVGGTADSFQLLYRPMTGDGRITAQLRSFTANGNGSAQAGVMFRETLSPGSVEATMDITDGDGAEFLFRLNTNQATTTSTYTTNPKPRAPYWVRLTRVGNLITAERSSDGQTWFVVGTSQTIPMAPTIYVGLIVSAHSNSVKLAEAAFDNVAIGTSPSAAADSYSVNEDTALIVAARDGVLANDPDQEGDILTAAIVAGTPGLTLNGDGSFTYVPPTNFAGTASFTYKANDGTGTSAAVTVTLAVNPANETPSFTKGLDQNVVKNFGAQTVAGWATAISQGIGETGQLVDFVVTNTNISLFSVQPAVSATGTLTYASATGVTGTATVSVRIHDNGGTTNAVAGVDTSAVQTFSITIT